MKFSKLLLLSALCISYSLDLISAADDSYGHSATQVESLLRLQEGDNPFNLEGLELTSEDHFLEGAQSQVFSDTSDAKERLAEPVETYIDRLLALNNENKFGTFIDEDYSIIVRTTDELLAKLLFKYKLKYEARDGTSYTRKKSQADLDAIVSRINVLIAADNLTAPLNRKSQAAIEKIILEISEISSQD